MAATKPQQKQPLKQIKQPASVQQLRGSPKPSEMKQPLPVVRNLLQRCRIERELGTSRQLTFFWLIPSYTLIIERPKLVRCSNSEEL